jgi:hypothetical protein
MYKNNYKYYKLSQHAQFTNSYKNALRIDINDRGLLFSTDTEIYKFSDLGDVFLECKVTSKTHFSEEGYCFINRLFEIGYKFGYKIIRENNYRVAYYYSKSIEEAVSYNGVTGEMKLTMELLNGELDNNLISYRESMSRLKGVLTIGLDGEMYIAYRIPEVNWIK